MVSRRELLFASTFMVGLSTKAMANEPSETAVNAAANYLWSKAGSPSGGPAPFLTQAKEVAVELKSVMTDIESLGGHWVGCEVGTIQRYYGSDTLGLLRWTEMTPTTIIAAMQARFEGVGQPENTIVMEGNGEYRTQDKNFYMPMHSFIQTSEMSKDSFFNTACKRLRYLREKLLFDMTTDDKLFVFKSTDVVMSDEELSILRRAMGDVGKNTLLYVRAGTDSTVEPFVEDRGNGLLVGHIDHFQTATEHNVVGWTKVLYDGWNLWQHGKKI